MSELFKDVSPETSRWLGQEFYQAKYQAEPGQRPLRHGSGDMKEEVETNFQTPDHESCRTNYAAT